RPRPDGRPLTIKLIHHHSTHSPYFRPNASMKDLANFDHDSSIYRASLLVANSNSSLQLNNLRLELDLTKSGGFFANIGVGSSYILQMVYVDTGSSLFWINCKPCGFNLRMPEPIFDPNTSSTFAFDNCHSNICKASGTVPISCAFDLDNTYKCKFEVYYGDGSSCSGRVAREQFVFGEQILKGIFFGCSYKTKNIDSSGILGLADHSISLLAQLGYRRFGYCIGNVSDTSYSNHKLFLGNSVALLGYKTSLVVDTKYYINLEKIMVNGDVLAIDSNIFKKKGNIGGMVVDTGSTYTYMPLLAVKSFEIAVMNIFDEDEDEDKFTINNTFSRGGYMKLCYDGDVKQDLGSFPPVELIFERGATMDLTADNIFHQISKSSFCLGILPIEIVDKGATISILGNLIQQQFFTSFDLDKKEFAFERMDCATWD
ncbi:hypothetical protein MIMGU_mgv1a023760mg, partial [Erythranthe guttata]